MGHRFQVFRPQNPQGDHQNGVNDYPRQDAAEGGNGVGPVGGVPGQGPAHKAVGGPGSAAHEGGGHGGLKEELEIPGFRGGVFPDEEQVQKGDDNIAAER